MHSYTSIYVFGCVDSRVGPGRRGYPTQALPSGLSWDMMVVRQKNLRCIIPQHYAVEHIQAPTSKSNNVHLFPTEDPADLSQVSSNRTMI